MSQDASKATSSCATGAFARAAEAAPRGARRYLATFFPPEQNAWEDALAAGATDKLLDFDAINTDLINATMRRKTPCTIKYAAWQVERCPETQKLHAHAAMAFSDPILYTQLQKLPSLEAFGNDYKVAYNFEPTENGWPEKSACNYATKPESRVAGPYYFGKLDRIGQGKRTDLTCVVDTLRDAAQEGLAPRAALKRAADAHPEQFIKFARGLQDFAEIIADIKPWQTLEEVILLVGEPGSGKSTYARHNWPKAYTRAYPKNNQVYYCGYANHEALIYEEFVGGMQLQQFKKLADPGAPNFIGGEPRFTLPRSASSLMGGGGIAFGSRALIFISNTLPTRWWDLDKLGEDPYVVQRRFTKIIYFGGNHENKTAWAREFTDDKHIFWDFCKTAPITSKMLAKNAKDAFYIDSAEFRTRSALIMDQKRAHALLNRLTHP